MNPRSVCIYGVSGSTKTSQVYHLVKWLHGTKAKPGPLFGKKWRMIHSDGGGYAPFVDSGMVSAGIVDIFDFASFPFSLAGWRWLRRGYWPRVIKEGSNIPMTNDGRGFSGHEVFKTTKEEWEGLAGYIIEGLASSGEVMKAHISNQKEKVGFANSYLHTEEGEEFRGLDKGHYNIIQREIYEGHMKGFNTLPVPWLIYTSLLGKGIDKEQKETVYGPQIVGNASTPSSPQWFMDCLYLSKERYIPKEGEAEVEGYVAWFMQHLDANTGIPYLAKARVMPELITELLKYFPNGFCPLGYKVGIENYFKVLEFLNKKGVEELI